MKQRLFVTLPLASLIALVVACSGPDTEGACKKFSSLCSKSTGSSSVVVACDAKQLDDISNASEVVDCINGASACDGAMACLAKAKP